MFFVAIKHFFIVAALYIVAESKYIYLFFVYYTTLFQ
jgi:hypothetical protein